MIGLDTNVLVRALTLDDPEQSSRASDFLHEAEQHNRPLFLNVVVLCELVWTLRGKRYGYSRDSIADALATLLGLSIFQIQHRDQVLAAIDDFRQGEADFADYLIGRLNRTAGCDTTATLDHALSEQIGFQPL